MKKKTTFYLFFLLVLCAALIFRLVKLDLRPMHHDEANQAVKFGNLLEKGEYRYDKHEHHGPTLYYLTIPFAWLSSGSSFAALNEKTLRLVTGFFGTGAILLLLLFKGGFNSEEIFFSALFAALSPALVFYSRFYIQEMLLFFFALGAIASGWRYARSRSLGWAAATGFFLGMMYATKETSVIIFTAFIVSLVFTRLTSAREEALGKISLKSSFLHLSVFLTVALSISFLFYSSFFRNPGGFVDSFLAFFSYFRKTTAAGIHAHPWYYYLKMLGLSRYGSGPVWSEALILGMALAGCVAAFSTGPRKENSSHPLSRFLFFYTLFTTVSFSLIPYKTPWNMLPFYLGVILLAGCGVSFILRAAKSLLFQTVVISALCVGVFHLGLQSYRANLKYESDPRNPYVYAQTSRDFLNLVRRINDVALHHPEGKRMLIKIITTPDEAWPLPWYLRGFSRVGYWQDVNEAGELRGVPLIISSTAFTEKLNLVLGKRYQPEYYGLRPETLLVLYIREDLWTSVLND